MLYSIGDKVRVKMDLLNGKTYDDVLCNYEMSCMGDMILTIKNINDHSYDVCENRWFWSDAMLEPVKANSNTKENDNMNMPNIKDYKYNAETGETYIQWTDKTETWVRAEENVKKDQNYGFMSCVAKRAMGNTSRINNLYDKWAVRKPIQDKKAEAKRIKQEIEEKRIAEKRKAKREQWLIKKAARKRMRDYEARKLANEKYGVPLDFEE